MHKDFFRQELKIGDYVVSGNSYHYFNINEVLAFTNKMIRIVNINGKKQQSKLV